MKAIFAAAAAAGLLAGCLCREGNPYNVGAYPHQWSFPGPDYEYKVFGPIYFGEVKDFVREMEADGWEVWGYERASLPEDVMVNTVELDRPSKVKRPQWTFDIPRTMDDGVDPPAPKIHVPEEDRARAIPPYPPTGERRESVPPYVEEGVPGHQQKYLVVMRRWK